MYPCLLGACHNGNRVYRVAFACKVNPNSKIQGWHPKIRGPYNFFGDDLKIGSVGSCRDLQRSTFGMNSNSDYRFRFIQFMAICVSINIYYNDLLVIALLQDAEVFVDSISFRWI